MLVLGDKGFPVLLFPTSMGRYFQNKDFGLLEPVSWAVDAGILKLYCVDSIDSYSWYNKNIPPADRVKNHIWYDQFLMDEILPRMQEETGYQKIAVAGCSFGAYHATNFAFRHPEVCSYVFNMGGAYDITGRLDGYYDDNTYFNNPIDFIPGLQNQSAWEMGIVIGVGEYDFCLADSMKLSEILNAKGIQHWLDIRPGANHDWPIWRVMFQDYVEKLLRKEGLIL